MNVLVTGGAGYIGSHTCKALKLSGCNPVVVDNLVYGHEWAVKWGKLYKCDIQDNQKIREIIKNEKITAVIHFAAYAYVGESVREPLKYYDNNVARTISLINSLQCEGVDKIVFSSTCATYGEPERSPIEETFLQAPINPYGQTKLVVENMLKDLAKINKMKSVALRYFNAAGADSDCEIGEDHSPETHLIPLAIEACLKNDATLTVFGADYPTPDGTCVRDYIHVTDLADAHVRAVKSLFQNKASFRAYNLGTGVGVSVRDIIKAAEKATGKKMNVVFGERRPGDPPALVASPGKARDELGWQPQHSQIDDILQTATKWYVARHLK